jgi:PAS domain S-box-containing protein
VRESVNRRISGELPSDNYEFRIVRKNNDIRYVETYSSITVYEGKPAILGTLLDITERKQAESKLHEKELMLAESNRMLQLVLDTVPVGIFWKGRDSVYRGCNRRFAIDGGHESPAEIVGKTDYDLPWYEHAETFRKDDENVILSSKPKINYEETLTKSDGSQIWVCTSKVPLCDVENRVIGVLGIIEDITESKDALEELRKSEKRFRELVDLLPQTVVEVNEKGCVTFINDYGKEKYGFAQEDISQGIEIIKRVIPEEHERAEVEMERVLNGERIEGSEFTTLKNDGSALPALIYASPVRRVDGHHGGLVVTIDITERKNLESQLMQAQKMESIGTLAGGIAHDFNNLLTTILGCGQLLKMKGGFDVRSDNYVDRIIEAAEGAAQLTQNILAFSRKQPTKAAVVDVNMIVKKVEKMALRLVEENIELEVLLSKDDLNIVADTSQLEQILMNLIVNARDAMPDGGRLTIQAEQVQLDQEFIERHGGGGKPGRYAKIVVADNGIGMPRKTVDRIFEPFFTTKEVGKGTGLGLSITHGIVRKHDGYITVSSAPGKGTTFEVYIPLTDTAGDAQIATPAEVRLQKGNETLLVAENDPFTRNMLKTILEEGGYGIIEAVDGEDALQKYVQHKERIEMIILDVIMPKMNGNAVYDAIKVMDPFQRILFISGYTPDEISRSGIFQENPNLIKKPFLPDVLLTKIREVFAR